MALVLWCYSEAPYVMSCYCEQTVYQCFVICAHNSNQDEVLAYRNMVLLWQAIKKLCCGQRIHLATCRTARQLIGHGQCCSQAGPIEVNGLHTNWTERLKVEMLLGSPRFGTVICALEISGANMMPRHYVAAAARARALGKDAHAAWMSEVWWPASVVPRMANCFLSHGVLVGFLPGLVRINQKSMSAVAIPAINQLSQKLNWQRDRSSVIEEWKQMP